MKEVIIQENDANQRLDKFLLKTYPNLSKSMMYKAIRNKKIKVNRKRCTYDQRLVIDDHILLFLAPDVLEEKKREVHFLCDQLDVVYEDENILIVNKPAGLLSQSDSKENQDTLVSRIQAYLYNKNVYDPLKAQSFAPTICHRLDRNTQGLVIAAKNAQALRVVNEAIANRRIHKFYIAKVSGIIPKDTFTLSGYIKKENTKAFVSDHEKPGYQKAWMDVSVLSRNKEHTMVEIELHTGRFHQIRSLMGHIGHPLIGDGKYGYRGTEYPMMLVAYKLVFDPIDLPLKTNVFQLTYK